jgi:capsular polysaccharide export protein
VLVIGQVESDASIRYGGVDIFTNADLLKAVRLANTDAFIVYKPHPDIVQAVRFNSNSDEMHSNMYDLIIHELSLSDCLEWVDEVHTISSLSGFESLLRNVPVTCYGLPFYAGWGLTKDRHSIVRRNRKITIQELIAATLLLYPTYIHPKSDLYCTPEDLIKELYLMKNCEKGLIGNSFNLIYLSFIRMVMGLFHRIKGI